MTKSSIGIAGRVALLFGLAGTATAWAGPTATYWNDDAARILSADAPHPASFRALTLDLAGMADHLRDARDTGLATTVDLPAPEGGFVEFLVVDSGTLPARLQHKYPGILSFKGSDAEGRSLRLDVSIMGFQAMVFDPAGIWVVRPEVLGPGDRYLSFKRNELAVPEGMGECEVHDSGIDPSSFDSLSPAPATQTGVMHRVYRTAVAANHQYIAAVGGGTVEGGLAATVVAVNRVTEVYEREMSIQLTLVPDNDEIMYASASGDPFGANDGSVISIATGIINGEIGSGSYDIGHVFTTGSGGVAGLRVVCGSSKARGTTGLGNPIGDVFYIDYVAHEMGHQFGGNHPFNGTRGSCSGGNRNGPTAYEPGSGSTIMAYAGICAADDLQPNSDPYFHAISLQEITSFTSSGSGDCSVNTTNTNHAPIIDTAALPTGYTIPARTPFVLSGSATDVDDDPLTYSWEEWDLGPANPLSGGDIGSGPIFRAFVPVADGARMFPKLSTVLGGPAVPGETLPTTTRDLRFRLTVRDEVAGFGTSTSADVLVEVVAGAGPFRVTAPNSALVWQPGSTQTVTWDVAGTSAAPVSCATVDIALSGDSGQNFTETLALGVANDGSADITVPPIATSAARVSVSCADNLFFDVSDVDFAIPAGPATYTVGGTVSGLAGSGLALRLNGGNPLAIATNGAITFDEELEDGATYEVTIASQPTAPAQTCTIANGSGTIEGADVTDVAVSCVDDPPPTFTVGGTVDGLTGSGLALRLNDGDPLAIATNGAFTFDDELEDGATYEVTVASQPTAPAQSCTIVNGSGTIEETDVNDVAVSCVDDPPPAFTVGGTVSGLAGSGLALRLNGGDPLAIAINGAFTFDEELEDGASYEVTIASQPTAPAQTCTIANGNGTIEGADVNDVAVSCVDDPPPTFTVGGTVDGLTGAGLALRLNGGDPLAVATNGAFTFDEELEDGATYEVTIASQPTAPAQTCTIANGNGTIEEADVSDIAIACTDDPTDVIFANSFETDGAFAAYSHQ